MALANPETAVNEDATELCRGWEVLTGRPVAVSNLDHLSETRNDRWASDTEWNLRQLVKAGEDDATVASFGDFDKFVDNANLRGIFNIRLAQLIGLPYAANSSRLPIRHQQLKNALIAQEAFLDLDEIQRAVDQRTAAHVRLYTVQLPVLLTAAIERAEERLAGDLWEEIAELRHAATAYRARRRELLDALKRGNSRAFERVDRAVKSEAKRWYKIVRAETVLGIAGAVTTGLGTLAGVILRPSSCSRQPRTSTLSQRRAYCGASFAETNGS